MLKALNLCCKTSKSFCRTYANYKIKLKEKRNLPKVKAWQIHSYGDISELQLTSTRIPILYNPDDILVKVEAASLNPIDRLMIGGYGRTILNKFRSFDYDEFPLILGRDFAGKVIGMGHNASENFNIGDSVYGVIPIHKQGSHAEITIANKSLTRIRPKNWSAIEATSILYAAMTAWSALWLTGEFQIQNSRNLRVLILGASGGVGTVATQILKSYSTLVVGTCSSDALDLVHSLGADFVFDYTESNFEDNVASVGNYDIILDCAKFGHNNIPSNWNYKRYITLNSPLLVNTDKYGLMGGLASSLSELLLSNLKKTQGKSVRWGFFAPFSDGLTLIDELAKNGKITPTIHKVFKFSDIISAYDCLQLGHLRGKIVIERD